MDIARQTPGLAPPDPATRREAGAKATCPSAKPEGAVCVTDTREIAS
ncbi:hypothetical protein [Albidovulum sp.]|nr:hypothetical protein [Defluviimonas sp.]